MNPEAAVPKSDSEHLVFLQELSALMVNFALAWSRRHPGTAFSKALEERTFFFNLGAWHAGELYDHPEPAPGGEAAWRRFLADADALADRPDAEAAVLALLPAAEAYFVPRVARDQAELHHPVRGLAARPGCLWTFAEPAERRAEGQPSGVRLLEFHIANHRYPGSFLRDPGAVAAEVAALTRRARTWGFDGITTHSWLNDLPAWRACLPAVWTDRLSPADDEEVGGHLGCWGQVVTARQTLNPKAAAYLRTHGRFEFRTRSSWLLSEECR